jgi:predicted negative regulator of RcsB-dependent stress response
MQTALVIIAILAAVSYLGVKLYRAFFSKKSSCASCAFNEMNQKVEKVKN